MESDISLSGNNNIFINSNNNIELNAINAINFESENAITFIANSIIALQLENIDATRSCFIGLTTALSSEIGNLFNINIEENEPLVFSAILNVDSGNSNSTIMTENGSYQSSSYSLTGGKYFVGTPKNIGLIGAGTSGVIYTSQAFNETLGSIKLLVQGQGGNGGCQLSELFIVKSVNYEDEPDTVTVYHNEVSRVSGIGSVSFISSYDSLNNAIQIYADTSTDSTNSDWSFVVIPTEIEISYGEEMPV
jgi:hypothetical protein